MATYIPHVLVCGNLEDFKSTIGTKPVEVIGQIIFRRTDDSAKFFFGGRELTGEDLLEIFDGTAEYLIFTDTTDFNSYLKNCPQKVTAMTADAFAKKICDGFSSPRMAMTLCGLLNDKIRGRVLDFDCFLAKIDLHAYNDVDIACVAENFAGLRPVHENVYKKIYRAPDEYKYRTFSAVVLTRERTPDEFVDTLIELDSLSEKILVFVRKNSALESWLNASQKIFAAVETFPTDNGAWFLLKKISPPADICVYIVTHKDAQLPAVPEGYRIIHAGHALAKKDFGYLGDDTGDNISVLNRFLDEVTALYWVWKNTAHTHAGIVHYRRLFTNDLTQKIFDVKNIFGATEFLRLLGEYDIIVRNDHTNERTQSELMVWSTNSPPLVDFCHEVVRKHLARTHPDYLDAFDNVMGSFTFFPFGIFVTRRKILDAYCEWLFSFMLDATQELRDKIRIGDKNFDEVPHNWSRMPSFFAERMLTVWLTNNHLRIKTLPIMFRDDV